MQVLPASYRGGVAQPKNVRGSWEVPIPHLYTYYTFNNIAHLYTHYLFINSKTIKIISITLILNL